MVQVLFMRRPPRPFLSGIGHFKSRYLEFLDFEQVYPTCRILGLDAISLLGGWRGSTDFSRSSIRRSSLKSGLTIDSSTRCDQSCLTGLRLSHPVSQLLSMELLLTPSLLWNN